MTNLQYEYLIFGGIVLGSSTALFSLVHLVNYIWFSPKDEEHSSIDSVASSDIDSVATSDITIIKPSIDFAPNLRTTLPKVEANTCDIGVQTLPIFNNDNSVQTLVVSENISVQTEDGLLYDHLKELLYNIYTPTQTLSDLDPERFLNAYGNDPGFLELQDQVANWADKVRPESSRFNQSEFDFLLKLREELNTINSNINSPIDTLLANPANIPLPVSRVASADILESFSKFETKGYVQNLVYDLDIDSIADICLLFI